jgi:hypothetical protein
MKISSGRHPLSWPSKSHTILVSADSSGYVAGTGWVTFVGLSADPEVVEDNPEIAILMSFLTTCRMHSRWPNTMGQRPLLAMP